jgi:hypothetical protein
MAAGPVDLKQFGKQLATFAAADAKHDFGGEFNKLYENASGKIGTPSGYDPDGLYGEDAILGSIPGLLDILNSMNYINIQNTPVDNRADHDKSLPIKGYVPHNYKCRTIHYNPTAYNPANADILFKFIDVYNTGEIAITIDAQNVPFYELLGWSSHSSKIKYFLTREGLNDPAGKVQVIGGGVKIINDSCQGATEYGVYDTLPNPTNMFMSKFELSLTCKTNRQGLQSVGTLFKTSGMKVQIDVKKAKKEKAHPNAKDNLLAKMRSLLNKVWTPKDKNDFFVKIQQKRSGDWLQVLSCLDPRHDVGGARKLTIVTHDRICMAYALLMGVNVIFTNLLGGQFLYHFYVDDMPAPPVHPRTAPPAQLGGANEAFMMNVLDTIAHEYVSNYPTMHEVYTTVRERQIDQMNTAILETSTELSDIITKSMKLAIFYQLFPMLKPTDNSAVGYSNYIYNINLFRKHITVDKDYKIRMPPMPFVDREAATTISRLTYLTHYLPESLLNSISARIHLFDNISIAHKRIISLILTGQGSTGNADISTEALLNSIQTARNNERDLPNTFNIDNIENLDADFFNVSDFMAANIILAERAQRLFGSERDAQATLGAIDTVAAPIMMGPRQGPLAPVIDGASAAHSGGGQDHNPHTTFYFLLSEIGFRLEDWLHEQADIEHIESLYSLQALIRLFNVVEYLYFLASDGTLDITQCEAALLDFASSAKDSNEDVHEIVADVFYGYYGISGLPTVQSALPPTVVETIHSVYNAPQDWKSYTLDAINGIRQECVQRMNTIIIDAKTYDHGIVGAMDSLFYTSAQPLPSQRATRRSKARSSSKRPSSRRPSKPPTRRSSSKRTSSRRPSKLPTRRSSSKRPSSRRPSKLPTRRSSSRRPSKLPTKRPTSKQFKPVLSAIPSVKQTTLQTRSTGRNLVA